MSLQKIEYALAAELVNSHSRDGLLSPENLVEKMKYLLKTFEGATGLFVKQKLLEIKKIEELFIKCIYVLEFELVSIQFNFVYTRPTDVWQIHNFHFSSLKEPVGMRA